MNPSLTKVVVLIATADRWELLTKRAIPSVACQAYAPVSVVIVNDGACIAREDISALVQMFPPGACTFANNHRSRGAAGAWNTGLELLAATGHSGYVAILDDDDEWDVDHLASNIDAAREQRADIVVSGLRMLRDGVLNPRPLPQDLTATDFLAGNPGWQGSNTFVTLSAFREVGGFREGLPSLNDRDLALRLLRRPNLRVAYTNKWTATWHIDSRRPTLSTPRSEAKLQGLRRFWEIYGVEMDAAVRTAFFRRAFECFGIKENEILFCEERIEGCHGQTTLI